MADGQSEAPTRRRQERAASLAASARSPYLLAAAGLGTLALGAPHAGAFVFDPLRALFTLVLDAARDGTEPTRVLGAGAVLGARAIAAPLVAVLAAVVLAALAQVGPRFGAGHARAAHPGAPRALGERIGDAGAALLSATIVLCVAGIVVLANARGLFDLARRTPADAADVLGLALPRFVGWLAAVLVLVGLADLVVRRARIARASRMTRRELHEAWREAYGDPQVRARRRAVHAALGHGARDGDLPPPSGAR